jgi:lipid-A-disaccharide synthase
MQSEISKKSVVTANFWRLSLIGNILLLIHSFIQLQYPICLAQSCNGVISWRNLNLINKHKKPKKFNFVLFLLFFSLTGMTIAFALQGYLSGSQIWFRIPENPWFQTSTKVPLIWHLSGFTGIILFNSRFWIQWWCAERQQTSYLGASFWWLSLVGDLLCLSYFIWITDPVNVVGPLIGLVPYTRNLILINKSKQTPIPTREL